MNVYESLEILKNPDFAEYFAEAKEKRKEITDVIFDKEKIEKFSREYASFSEGNLSLIMQAVDEISEDEAYTSLCCAMYVFMSHGSYSVYDIKPNEEGTVKSEFALLLAIIACGAEFCEKALQRGVSKEILAKTFSAVDMYVTSNAKRKGIPGTSGYHRWLPRYAMGKLFRLGAFQFEIRSFEGKDMIGVHIPRGTKLDVGENIENFRYALEFFKKYYSEYDFRGFSCESWLVNPFVEEIMGRKTNIARFGDMFENRHVAWEEEDVFGNLYQMPKPENLDDLPEETSLQRNVKKYLKDGNSFKDYRGFISLQRLEDIDREHKNECL